MSMYKAKDAIELRNTITAAIQVAFKEALKINHTFKVNSSNVMHTDLQPEGDVFTINFVVEVHKKDEPDDVPARSA
jgi:predicted RNase H-related nuclease YkuK (DUF458 family)